MKKLAILFSVLLAVVVFSGCAAKAVKPYKVTTKPVTQGYFASKGYKIVADDKSFVIKGGESFKPPFQSDMYGCAFCKNYYYNHVNYLIPETLLSKGAKKVKVYRGKDMLYGILALNKVFTAYSPSSYTLSAWTYSNPSLRSYELIVPKSQFDSALNGRTELVYEIFAQVSSRNSVTKRPRKALSWVLLLSRTPF